MTYDPATVTDRAESLSSLPSFPSDAQCPCGGDVAYWEDVPSRRRIEVDDDGTVWVSGYSEEIDDAAANSRFECSQCLREFAEPTSWDWGS